MKELLHRHHDSIKNAIAGLEWSFRTQPNFKIHVLLSLAALLAAWYFHISFVEITVLLFTILLGLMAEMINTALESMTDLITTEWKAEAKIAKDVSAGMMLLVAMGAVVIAGIIFVPRLGLPF